MGLWLNKDDAYEDGHEDGRDGSLTSIRDKQEGVASP